MNRSHRVFYVFLTLCIALVSFSFAILYLLYAGMGFGFVMMISPRTPLSAEGLLRLRHRPHRLLLRQHWLDGRVLRVLVDSAIMAD